jgi:3-hydroxyisobutyrate dehydrogenase-like beta-hydroxyacid dehydrogenase
MGQAVARVCVDAGFVVLSCLGDRSAITHERARRAGVTDVADLEALVREADLLLSIMPPAAAETFASRTAAVVRATGRRPLFVDCNAVSPTAVRRMRDELEDAGAGFLDVGIIGSPPGKDTPRFYASGPQAEMLAGLKLPGIDVRPLGDEVGRASGMKMVYAALTKGTMTLRVAVLIAAWQLGLFEELGEELQESQEAAWTRMEMVPFHPADAARWVGEMEQIAETFGAVGVTDEFHKAAAEIFRLMASTPFAAETRETLDRTRTLEQTISTFAKHLR